MVAVADERARVLTPGRTDRRDAARRPARADRALAFSSSTSAAVSTIASNGASSGQPSRPSSCLERTFVIPSLQKATARVAQQLLDALDRVDLDRRARRARQPDSLELVPISSTRWGRLNSSRCLAHARDDPGLRNGLTLTDRQRRIFVGTRRERFLDEQMTRQLAHDVEHAAIADAIALQAFDESVARTLRGHAETARFGRQARIRGHADAACAGCRQAHDPAGDFFQCLIAREVAPGSA